MPRVTLPLEKPTLPALPLLFQNSSKPKSSPAPCGGGTSRAALEAGMGQSRQQQPGKTPVRRHCQEQGPRPWVSRTRALASRSAVWVMKCGGTGSLLRCFFLLDALRGSGRTRTLGRGCLSSDRVGENAVPCLP